MSQTITIDPVTRIEGHSKITIQLDDRGEVVACHLERRQEPAQRAEPGDTIRHHLGLQASVRLGGRSAHHHLLEISAQLVGDNLRKGGVQALPMG